MSWFSNKKEIARIDQILQEEYRLRAELAKPVQPNNDLDIVEDQEVLSNVAPADFLNKEFKVEGTFEAIWQNESDFKTVALATPNIAQAMLVDILNTDVNIGVVPSHPEVKILFDKVYFTEFSRPLKIKDLIHQVVKFKATYSTTNSEMIAVTTTNTVASY